MLYQDIAGYSIIKNVLTKSLATLLLGSVSFESLDISYAQSTDRTSHHNSAINVTPTKPTVQTLRRRHPAKHNAQKAAGDDMSGMYMGGPPPTAVENITVSKTRLSPVQRAAIELWKIPGGTSLVDAKMTLRGRNATFADALSYQPGVFAQSPNGSDALRISIRGSGIQTGMNYVRSGITFLFDGVPLTTPTGTIYELWEPLGTRLTEIYRGGNAFDYGAYQLGGAINYISNTGYDAKHWQARFEAGSYGYLKEQLSAGRVIGKADYYISLTKSDISGYQANTKGNSFGVNANFGYKFNNNVDTRLYFRYRQVWNGYPGYLTRAQIQEDPRQAQSVLAAYGAKTIKPGTKFLADKTNIRIDDHSKLIASFAYLDAPMDHENGPISNIYDYKFASGTVNYKRNDKIFNRKSETDFGIWSTNDLSASESDRVRIPSLVAGNPPMGATVRHARFNGQQVYLHLRNNYELFPNFWLTTAGALAWIAQGGDVLYPSKSSLHQSAVHFIPRGGFRYEITPSFQIYGNVTRGIQPINEWQLLSGAQYTSGPAVGLNSGWSNLDLQTATTFEVGTTGRLFNSDWSIGYYHSHVRNELLSVTTLQSEIYHTSVYGNASPTTHQGVEVSTHSTLWQKGGNKLMLLQAYTYQDFRFNHDTVFGHNKLPGIAAHFYQGMLHLDLANGFYFGAMAQVSSSVYTTYDNQAKAAPYHIFSVNAGYKWPKKDMEVFISAMNLANKHYAAAVVPVYTATNHDAAAETPGMGLSITGGIDIGFN